MHPELRPAASLLQAISSHLCILLVFRRGQPSTVSAGPCVLSSQLLSIRSQHCSALHPLLPLPKGKKEREKEIGKSRESVVSIFVSCLISSSSFLWVSKNAEASFTCMCCITVRTDSGPAFSNDREDGGNSGESTKRENSDARKSRERISWKERSLQG